MHALRTYVIAVDRAVYADGLFVDNVTPAVRDRVSSILSARGCPTELADLPGGGLMFKLSIPLDEETTRKLLGIRGVGELANYVQ